MNIWGISANSHDAAVSVWHDKELQFAAHSERYSGIKNDGDLNAGIIEEAMQHGSPDLIVWYENPLKKTARQLWAGQGLKLTENNIASYLSKYNLERPIVYQQHHKSHAAAGYYTSGLKDATVVVIDAIGEFECLTVWQGEGNRLKQVFSQSYPHSVGIWFSAMTQRCNLNPTRKNISSWEWQLMVTPIA